MKYYVNTIAAVVLAVAASAPAFAGSQLAASAGISPEQEQFMSLSEIAQAKFNRDTRGDDRHPTVVRGTPSGDYGQLAAIAGVPAEEAQGMSLGEVFVAKINRESRGDEQQAVKGAGVTMASRSVGSSAAYAQLAASAGLSAEEAAGLSLNQIAAAKFARDTYSSDN